jgi:hypothetical protein
MGAELSSIVRRAMVRPEVTSGRGSGPGRTLDPRPIYSPSAHESRSLDQPSVTSARNRRATSCGAMVGAAELLQRTGRDAHVDEDGALDGERLAERGVEAGEVVAARRLAVAAGERHGSEIVVGLRLDEA